MFLKNTQVVTRLFKRFPWQHYLPRFIGYDLSSLSALKQKFKHPFEI